MKYYSCYSSDKVNCFNPKAQGFRFYLSKLLFLGPCFKTENHTSFDFKEVIGKMLIYVGIKACTLWITLLFWMLVTFPKAFSQELSFPNVQFTNRQLHTSYLAASFGPLSGCSCSAWPPSPFIATTLGPHCSLLCLMAPHPDIINDALKKLKRKKKFWTRQNLNRLAEVYHTNYYGSYLYFI